MVDTTPVINVIECGTFKWPNIIEKFGPHFSRNGRFVYHFEGGYVLIYDTLISQSTTLTGDLNFDNKVLLRFYEFDENTLLILTLHGYRYFILTLDFEKNQFTTRASLLNGLHQQDRVHYQIFESHLPDKCFVQIRTWESNYRTCKMFLVDKNGSAELLVDNWHLRSTSYIKHFNLSTKYFYTYDLHLESAQTFKVSDNRPNTPTLISTQRSKNVKTFFNINEYTAFTFNDNVGYKIVKRSAKRRADDVGNLRYVAHLYVYNMDNDELSFFETNLPVRVGDKFFFCFTENVLVLHSFVYFGRKKESKTYRIHLRKPPQLSELAWYARPLDFPLDHKRFGIGR